MKNETTMPKPIVMFSIAVGTLALAFYLGYFVL